MTYRKNQEEQLWIDIFQVLIEHDNNSIAASREATIALTAFRKVKCKKYQQENLWIDTLFINIRNGKNSLVASREATIALTAYNKQFPSNKKSK